MTFEDEPGFAAATGFLMDVGRRDCVRKVRLESTCESLVRIALQIDSMISSS